MYSNTRFSQLLKAFPQKIFNDAVERYQSDKYSKGFRCHDQFIAMLYGQLNQSKSLRELTEGFNIQSQHHYHLNTRSVKRSTLADANAKRDARVYMDVATHLLSQVKGKLKRELKEQLYLLDSTPILLIKQPYDSWTKHHNTHRIKGLKLHMMIEQQANAPIYANISHANLNDVDDARQMPIDSGVTYVFDKGYCSYNWWYDIDQAGSYFVTRFKRNAALVLCEQQAVKQGTAIISDDIVKFKNKVPRGGAMNHYHQQPLRRICVKREGKATPLILATNDMESPAELIAERYKQRWQIELFFKWLKQRLKIKTFLGTSENAVRTQIYIALIAYLLIWLEKRSSSSECTLIQMLWQIRSQLFHRVETDYQMYKRRREHLAELQKMQGVLPL